MKTSAKRLYVLNLTRWYPHRFDPMPGLFVQRHAEAIALYTDVALVYAHGVMAKPEVPLFDVDVKKKAGVLTAEVYFRLPATNIPLISPAIKLWRFFKAIAKGIGKVKIHDQNFDVIHVHVLTRLGIVALFFKWFYGIPYVITEHWTRYLDQRNDFTGFFRIWLTRLVVKKAAVVTTVSKDLGHAMKKHKLGHPDYRVIHNVVDPIFFAVASKNAGKKETSRKELVHVSCFTDIQKNISGLLRVVHMLSVNRDDFHFTMIGDGEDLEKMKNYAVKLKIPEKVLTFTGLLEGRLLAETMAGADALVLFSNYENMPVVINESFVLGVPVISTDVGGIAEMVNENRGRLVAKGDETALTDVLSDFLDGKMFFDKGKIQQFARKQFSKETVGKDLLGIYYDALKKGEK